MSLSVKTLLSGQTFSDKTGTSALLVHGLSYNSKTTRKGDLFFCLRGVKQDGHLYAPEAVRAGAAALVVEEWLELDVPQVKVESARKALASAARAFYGHPAERLGLIGVTGTNGKTTTTFMIRSILLQQGLPVGLIGTVHNVLGAGLPEPATMTTPESLDLQRLFRRALDDGCKWLVMEVSSHALAQERVDPAEFDLGLILNVKRDHFEFHKTFEHYLASKLQLVERLRPERRAGRPKAAIINADDRVVFEACKNLQVPVVTFGLNSQADISGFDLRPYGTGTRFELRLPGASPVEVDLPLSGRFNVSNALAAAAAAWQAGVAPTAIKAGLEACRYVPGRMERVETGSFEAVVDFAHNPAAIEAIASMRPANPRGRTILVFGAEGGKDQGKRPEMGLAASKADYLIITSDNMYEEDPAKVAAQVAGGVAGTPYEIVLDRRLAIERAVELARPEDLLIVAGKGHEETWVWQGAKIAHDDRQAIREAAARKASGLRT